MNTRGDTKRRKQAEVTATDFLVAGKEMMNRSEKKMGKIDSEERRFREMFGVDPKVAAIAWQMMAAARLMPRKGTMQHWLWTLCFLKVHAKQGPMCALCGGVDPKTFKKWVNLFLEAFVNLETEIASVDVVGSLH